MDLPDDIKTKAQDLVRDVTSYRAYRVPCTFCGQWHGETGVFPFKGFRIPFVPTATEGFGEIIINVPMKK